MECKNCQEGNVFIQHTVTVSRDMAMDAGDLSLEGAAWDWGSEWIGCDCCQGEWQDCPACNAEAQSNTVLQSDKSHSPDSEVDSSEKAIPF